MWPLKFVENKNRKVINFDLDGTLTNGEPYWDKEPTPVEDQINKLRKLYSEGHIIIIHTGRQWEFAPETVGWLIKNRIPFHGIYMAKGGADIYVDDRSINSYRTNEKYEWLNAMNGFKFGDIPDYET